MTFARTLLVWYEKNARELPWRLSSSPYRTWVSEVMLQQTQVDTVIPYFLKWMAAFPDVAALASADLQEVLTLWEGLGYYSRARNLHKAAKMVVAQYDGKLPGDLRVLEKLPGIGRYTAAAIASIAFGLDEAAVDSNIRRVLSRYFDVQQPARSPEGEKILWSLAQQNLPKGRGGDYNQALMDLGATICTPKNPVCDQCSLAGECIANQLGIQELRPVKLPRKKIPHATVTAAVIPQDGKVLLAQRSSQRLLGGLWEFPGGTLEEEDINLESCLIREIKEELGVEIRVGEPFGVYKHAYTHFKITLHAFLCELVAGQTPQALASDNLAWVDRENLSSYPKGNVDRLIATRFKESGINGTISG